MATQDNGVRENQSLEALAKLKPYFDRKFGTVTAGNSSQITDGGAAVLVMSARRPRRRAATVRSAGSAGFAFCALEPERMGLGPAVATPLALKRAGLSWKDIGLVEINEAFAAQVLACARVFPSAAWHAKYGTGGPDRRDRLGQDQRQRRRDRARPPGRLLGEPARDDAPEGDAAARHAVRPGDDVHRRRPGRRGRRGAAL